MPRIPSSLTTPGLLALFALGACASPFEVVHLEPPPVTDDAFVVYALPRAELKLTAVVSKTSASGGVCAKAEDDGLRTGIATTLRKARVPEAAVTKFENGRSAKQFALVSASVETVAIADPSHRYAVYFKRKTAQKRAASLGLTEHGFLTEATSSAENTTTEIVLETVQAVASVAGTVIGLADGEDCNAVHTKLAEDVLKRDHIETHLSTLTDQPKPASSGEDLSLQLAQLNRGIAHNVERILGASPPPAKATVVCLAEIPDVLPADWKGPSITISATDGVVNPGGRCTVPTSFVGAAAAGSEVTTVAAKLTMKADTVLDAYQKSGDTDASGLAYRVPGWAVLELFKGDDVIQVADVAIPQWGVVRRLPGNGDDLPVKANVALALHPSTGAPQKISVDFGTAPISGISDTAGSVAGTIGKIGEALEKPSPTDELAKIKAQICLEKFGATGVMPDGC